MSAPTPTIDGRDAGSAGASWWVLLFAFALAIRVFSIGDAWSPDNRDLHGIFGAYATGGPVTTLAQRGLFESGGMPVEWRVDLADGSTETRYYMHHPPTYMLLSAVFMELLGTHSAVLRLPPLLFSLFSIWATYRLARHLGTERVARFAALLMAAVPFSARDGMQCWTEGAIAGTTCLVVLHAVRFMDGGGTRELLRAALWLAAGGLLDWPAYFVLPGLAVWGAWRCSREGDWGRMGRALLLPLVMAALLGLHLLHMYAVVGAEGIARDTGGALAEHMPWPDTFAGVVHFFRLQGIYQVLGFTTPVLLLALVGAIAASTRGSRVRAAAIWLGLPSGLLYVLLFPGRSGNHDFFMLVSAPAVCIAAAAGLDLLAAQAAGFSSHAARRAVDGLTSLVVVWCTWNVVVTWVTYRSDEMSMLVSQPWLREVLHDERAVVITHLGRGACLPFYSRAPVVYGTANVADLETHLATIVDRIEPERRAVFFFDEHWGLQNPEMVPVLEELLEIGEVHEYTVDLGADHFSRGAERFYLVDLPTGGAL